MFDSLQNAAMASRGAWDAYNNCLNFSNGLAMVGGILGLGGNAASIRQIGKVEATAAASLIYSTWRCSQPNFCIAP